VAKLNQRHPEQMVALFGEGQRYETKSWNGRYYAY